MEPGDLQPLTVYNEHAPGAHGHRHPQQALGLSKEVMGGGGCKCRGGGEGGSEDAGGDAWGHPRVHSPCCSSTSLCWVLICGLPAMWSDQRERKGRRGGKKGGRKEGRDEMRTEADRK